MLRVGDGGKCLHEVCDDGKCLHEVRRRQVPVLELALQVDWAAALELPLVAEAQALRELPLPPRNVEAAALGRQ